MKKSLSAFVVGSLLFSSTGTLIANAEESTTVQSENLETTITKENTNNLFINSESDASLVFNNDFEIAPLVAVENEPGGTVVSSKNSKVTNYVSDAIYDTITIAVGGIMGAVSFKWGNTQTRSAVLGAVGTAAATFLANTKTYKYLTTKLVKYYSSTYKQYVYQMYTTVYSNSDRTNVVKVYLSPQLKNINGALRDVKFG